MSNTVIRSELEQRLQTWANSFNPVIPIAWEGVAFQLPSERYLQPFMIPAATTNPSVDGSRKRYTGIFQVNVYVKDGKGTKAINELCDSLINYFPVIPKSGNVSIEQTPSVSNGIALDGWRVVPVSIPYRMES